MRLDVREPAVCWASAQSYEYFVVHSLDYGIHLYVSPLSLSEILVLKLAILAEQAILSQSLTWSKNSAGRISCKDADMSCTVKFPNFRMQ